tara:strand:+ start:1823 stop:2038 length:216 start_codon:yes stop_codon:yes gene_type:complete
MQRERILMETLSALSLTILQLANEHGRLTVADIVKLTGTNRNTVKMHLAALVTEQPLAPDGKGERAWYGGM